MKSNISLTYPTNLSELYISGEKNYIQFQSISYNAAKKVQGENNKLSIEAKSSITNAITLELNDTINLSDGHNWSAVSLIDANSSNIGDISKNVGDRLATIIEVGIAQKLLNLVSVGSIDPNIIENEITFNQGKTLINPNTTLIYNNTEPKQLNLEYIMRPINETESVVITKIIEEFKEKSRASAAISGIYFPNVWYIKTSSDNLNRLLESGPYLDEDNNISDKGIAFACTSVATNINTSFLYHNKFPNQITLGLSFIELKPRYKKNSEIYNK